MSTISRQQLLTTAERYFDEGHFQAILARRVAIPTESQNPQRASVLNDYLATELQPWLEAIGFSCEILKSESGAQFLFAQRIENPKLNTVFSYGHGDVIRGLENEWSKGLTPWQMTERDGRWYGRGVADNKGQHSVNLCAMKLLLDHQGHLGFNVKFLFEMGEEVGSPGLREICRQHKEILSADLMIASDGPRLRAERPTLFLGSRGSMNFDLIVEPRKGAHHSGNWGGLISNPGITLAHALASIVSSSGQIMVREWVPTHVPDTVRHALADCEVDGGSDGPKIDAHWGEPGLSPAERVFAWSTCEVLAFKTGNPQTPVNAIPAHAWARCQIRFVVGTDPNAFLPALRKHLDAHGFSQVRIESNPSDTFLATRIDPENPWVTWAAKSLQTTTGKKTAVLPNLGGSLPNDIFTDELGLVTIWVPHSYPGCSQHAPNEHLPINLLREGLLVMCGLFWDLAKK